MPMDAKPSPMTVADFCDGLKRGDILVNHEYQRSSKVWPPAARSFLIETILLGYPMPKLSLHQITDVKTKKTLKEIVDGQQRTSTILAYFNNEFKLMSKALPSDAAGRQYDDLDPELQAQFLSYLLSIDLFVGATKDDIREIFRRMNSYTVPLNAEEKRHSRFQGDFKWFVYRLSKQYSQTLESLGVLTDKQFARMQDAKLFSEIAFGVLVGLKTTKDKELTRLYEDFDKSFPHQTGTEKRITRAIDAILEMPTLSGSALMKPHQFLTLVLAVSHAQQALPSLGHIYSFGKKRIDWKTAESNLGILASAIDDGENAPKRLVRFVEAGASKTNVSEQRQTRFQWICRAIDDTLP